MRVGAKLGVEMPIAHEVYHILYEDISPIEAARRLMTRDLKNELDDQDMLRNT